MFDDEIYNCVFLVCLGAFLGTTVYYVCSTAVEHGVDYLLDKLKKADKDDKSISDK